MLMLLFSLVALTTEARSPYPTILRADRGDPLFVQHQAAVARYYRASAQGEPLPSLRIYEYELAGERTLHAVAARFTLTVESIATLNRLTTLDIPAEVDRLLIPSLPGIFLVEEPATSFEMLLHHERSAQSVEAPLFPVLLAGESARFRFLPEERLSGAEQRHLLGSFFRMPLEEATVTSRFGYRTHPILGFRSFHRGVDFRSPRGANVYAAASGTVTEVGRDGVLGVYAVVEHAGGYRTTYAHMSEVVVQLNQELLSGSIVGRVGSTGISTGPHLHFEIAQGDRLYDPLELLPLLPGYNESQ